MGYIYVCICMYICISYTLLLLGTWEYIYIYISIPVCERSKEKLGMYSSYHLGNNYQGVNRVNSELMKSIIAN